MQHLMYMWKIQALEIKQEKKMTLTFQRLQSEKQGALKDVLKLKTKKVAGDSFKSWKLISKVCPM